ncbi:hypothetical protein F4679DRAFT_425911 [Xylaria curta]|nr:hypothetical protein F4679DRAFT_425911 [Xylaria curta]
MVPVLHHVFDPSVEEDVLLSFGPMVRAVALTREPVMNLPLTGDTLPNKPKTQIVITDHHMFSPLGIAKFEMLKEKVDDDHQWALAAETLPPRFIDSLVDWAESVTAACRVFSKIRDDMSKNGEERIQCAGFSDNSIYPVTESQRLLLEGECMSPSVCRPMWFVPTFLISTSRRHGCILATWTWEHPTPEQVLRNEMITLLLLLEFASVRAVRNGESSMTPTVFVLSFTHTQARVLEARVEKPGTIVISIRAVLDDVPTEAERDQKFQELTAWTMYTDNDNAYTSPGVSAVTIKRAIIASNYDTDDSNETDKESDRDSDGNSATTSETADTSYTQES